MSSAILLIAHGSRVPAANCDLLTLAAMLGERLPDEIIECAYLELAEPSIPQGMAACVARGAASVRLLPYFLSAGAHVTRDLEAFRAQFEEAYPEINVSVCRPLGLHPRIVDVLVERLQSAESPDNV